MWRTDRLAEKRIEAAISKGELDGLPGQGQPLRLEEDQLVAPEIRMAYRVLKNAGYIPEEVILRKEIARIEELMVGLEDGEIRARAIARLNLLSAKLSARHRVKESLLIGETYQRKVVKRMSESSGT
jgi:hypothetical protein